MTVGVAPVIMIGVLLVAGGCNYLQAGGTERNGGSGQSKAHKTSYTIGVLKLQGPLFL